MTTLARLVLRRRRAIVFAWIALTLLGAYSANAVSKRWLEQFSIPGYSAYEGNQRTLRTFGTGAQAPMTVVFHSAGDITKDRGLAKAIASAAKVNPGSRVSSYFSTGSNAYVSQDRHTTFANIYPPGKPSFNSDVHIKETRRALLRATPRPRPPLRGVERRQQRWPKRPHGSLDRRPRRARDPSLRLRHAAGDGDTDRNRDRLDPEHLHADPAADLHHVGLDHRAVPGRPRGPRCGDRLLPVDDLPLPRGIAERRRRRHCARRDDAPRRALGDRVGLNSGDRPGVDG